MSPEAKEKRNAYMRDWRSRNPDKVKRINSRYWENKSHVSNLEEWRCGCGKLLGKIHAAGTIETKCPRCSKLVVFEKNIEALEAL